MKVKDFNNVRGHVSYTSISKQVYKHYVEIPTLVYGNKKKAQLTIYI